MLHEQPRGDGQLRNERHQREWLLIDKPLTSEFVLVVKHPALFTAMPPELSDCFQVFANGAESTGDPRVLEQP